MLRYEGKQMGESSAAVVEPVKKGLYPISDAAYRELPHMNHSGLRLFAGHSPPPPKARFLLIGTAYHACMTQPEIAAATYCKAPLDWDLRTVDGKQALAEFEAETGKVALRPKEHAELRELIRATKAEPAAKKILDALGDAELTAIGQLVKGVWCKALIDKVCKGCLVDLKTTSTENQQQFEDSIIKYGYDSQAAFYVDLFKEVTDEDQVRPFFWLCVSKRNYSCWVSRAQPWHIHSGRRWYRDVLGLYARGTVSGVLSAD